MLPYQRSPWHPWKHTYLFFFSISVLEEYRACKENSYVTFIVYDFSAGPSLNRDDWKCYNVKNTYIGLILLHQLSMGFILNFAQMNNFMKYLMFVFVNTYCSTSASDCYHLFLCVLHVIMKKKQSSEKSIEAQ